MTDAVPEPTWLLECRLKGEKEWWLTTAKQRTEECERCGQNIFAKNKKSEHRA